jgi:hypothetical protein
VDLTNPDMGLSPEVQAELSKMLTKAKRSRVNWTPEKDKLLLRLKRAGHIIPTIIQALRIAYPHDAFSYESVSIRLSRACAVAGLDRNMGCR